jgi:basic amino acid/polyamine antiporter, APA family
VAIGNLLARAFSWLDSWPLYALAGRTIYAPRLAAGILLAFLIAWVNYRGIRPSGIFQDVMTFGLLAIFAVFATLGFMKGSADNLHPLFARPGAGGAWLSTLLVLQVVPYFMTGFESVAKGSEEARAGFEPRNFGTAMTLALVAGVIFYSVVVSVVAFIFPWRELVAGHIGTERAFERAFGSPLIARLIIFAAFLSLLKIFNGNFVAATRLLLAMGRRRMVHPALARVHARFGTPGTAILFVTALTIAATCLGDAILVPVTEVGSLAAGVGWFSACVAWLIRDARRRKSEAASGVVSVRRGTMFAAWSGLGVSLLIVGMKLVPQVPGSFSSAEWLAVGLWLTLGLALWQAGRVSLAPQR